jgi:lycopene beta-cyclase
MNDFEFAITGAGLAGLSLASSLSRANQESRICLIEPRTHYKRDHVWCFWNNAPTTLKVPIKRQWRQWKVRYRNRASVCSSQNYPYCCVLAEDYYEESLAQLRQSEKVDFFFGESLQEVDYNNAGIALRTEQRTISTRLLFDSRPPQFDAADFKQDFFGLQVQTEKNVFDPDCVTLMDFSGLAMNEGFHFYYLLPFSASEALVESVYIGLQSLPEAEHRRLVASYLSKEYGVQSFDEVYIERGCIPMQLLSMKQPDKRHYQIGTRGGLVRASTGYAFASIHRFSEGLSKALAVNQLPEPPKTMSAKAKLLDQVLLGYLRQRPKDGPLLLSSLFERVNADVVVRFLADCSSLADDAAIFAAMPRKFELSSVMARMCL